MIPIRHNDVSREQRRKCNANFFMPDFQTTVRLDPAIKSSLDKLRSIHKLTLNRLINDAIAKHVNDLLAEKAEVIEASRDALQDYLAIDPDFEFAIADVVAGEVASHADPVEGQIIAYPVPTEGDENEHPKGAIRTVLDG